MVFIYTLSDPISKEIRYVGKTNYALKDRLAKHLCTKERNHRGNWIKSLLNKNLKPVIDLLEIVADKDWQFIEQYWIAQFKAWGFNLVNLTKGGESGIISPQCRKAAIEKNTGRVVSEKEKIYKRLNASNSKPVLAIKEGITLEFISASEAARSTKSNLAHIIETCQGKRKSHNGYKWNYKQINKFKN